MIQSLINPQNQPNQNSMQYCLMERIVKSFYERKTKPLTDFYERKIGKHRTKNP